MNKLSGKYLIEESVRLSDLYRESLFDFDTNKRLTFDEKYRSAQLPLVAPQHPNIIHSVSNEMTMGVRFREVVSLIVEIPWSCFNESESFRNFLMQLKNSTVSRKIAWEIFELRKEKLHFTIASGLGNLAESPEFDTYVKNLHIPELAIGGAFVGKFNCGRVYLKVYSGSNSEIDNPYLGINDLNSKLKLPRRRLLLIGLINFTEELTENETNEIRKIIEIFWKQYFFYFSPEEIFLTATSDDLNLSVRRIKEWKLKR